MSQPPTETDQRPPTDRHASIVLWATIVIAVLVRLYLMRSTGSTSEDFYITLRYAENLAHGNGFVYNAGEYVLGTTTPLYTLFLALASWLGADAATWGKLLNIAADGAGCWLVWRLGKRAGYPGAGLIAAGLFALSPPNLTWSISGMETSLVTACTLALFASVAEKRLALVAITAALLYMLRVDGLLAVFVGFGALSWSQRSEWKSILRCFTQFLLLCAPWTIFAWAYFGSPLPTSALAKLTVYAWMSKGALPNLGPFVHQMTHSPLHLVILAGTLVGLVRGVSLSALRPAIIWMATYYAGMALSKGFLFGWYYVPPSGVYFFSAVIGWEYMIRAVGRGLRPSQPSGQKKAEDSESRSLEIGLSNAEGQAGTETTPYHPAFISASVVLLLGLVMFPKVRSQVAADQQSEERLRKPIGIALKEIVRPGERVMLEPIGYIGYFSGAKVLDAVGLVSPEVIPYYRKGAVSPYLDILNDMKPEWVLLRAGELEDAEKASVPRERALSAHYKLNKTYSDSKSPSESTPAFFLFKRL